jgi:hypothetical protein
VGGSKNSVRTPIFVEKKSLTDSVKFDFHATVATEPVDKKTRPNMKTIHQQTSKVWRVLVRLKVLPLRSWVGSANFNA